MKTLAKSIAFCLLPACLCPSLFAADPNDANPTTLPTVHVAHDALFKLHWQLAVPTGTFTDKTVFQSIDLLHQLNIHHLELTPGQPLDQETPAHPRILSPILSAPQAAKLLAKLNIDHMDITSFGPANLGPDDASARPLFAFAKLIKAKQIVASPPPTALNRLDKLASEFKLILALSNTPPNTPADLLIALTNQSPRIGIADDLARWQAPTADPLAATQLLHNRIVQIRISQTPTPDLQPILAELKSRQFKGIITLAPPPGTGNTEITRFANALNALSNALTKTSTP